MTTVLGGLRALCATLVATVTAATTFGQQATVSVHAPKSMYELSGTVTFEVTAEMVNAGTPQFAVFVDSNDVTSTITIDTRSESSEDANSDGVVETYEGSFDLDLTAYPVDPGQIVRVVAWAGAPSGTVSAQDASQVLSHAEVFIDDRVDAGSTAVHVAVQTNELRVQSQTIAITLDGTDVTSQVSITGPQLAAEVTIGTSPVLVRYRMQRYYIDISALGSSASGRLAVTATINASAGASSSSGSAAVTPSSAAGPSECHEAALKTFCDALGVTKGATAVSMTATPAEAKAATSNFKAALAQCPTGFPSGIRQMATTDVNGNPIVVFINVGGTGADVSVSRAGDFVIAIGGEGNGSSDGGNATATNTQPGGGSFAAGGDGGSGASSAGNGGNGKATATPPGNALGMGGNGGSPSPNTNAGGGGGSGNSHCGTTNNGTGGGSGAPGSGGGAGSYGGGGWGQSGNGSGSSGQFTGGSNP